MELLSGLVEITHAHYAAFVKVHSERDPRIPELRLPRPPVAGVCVYCGKPTEDGYDEHDDCLRRSMEAAVERPAGLAALVGLASQGGRVIGVDRGR